jgi:hypothetical protein
MVRSVLVALAWRSSMAWLSAGAELLISFPTNPVFECPQKPQLATGGYWSGPSG